jgi:phenylacetate-CoA ligase
MSRFKRIAFNAKNHLRSPALSFYSALLAAERLGPEALALLNCQKRKAQTAFAFDHTVFYRRAFEATGISRDDLADPSTFERLPILLRSDIVDHFDDLIADTANPGCWSKATTGGSTGTPLTVLHDRRVPIETAWWRVARWWEADPSDDIAFIYRIRRTFLSALANSLLWWPTKRIFLDASLMTTQAILNFVTQYNAVRPAILQGYVGGVYEFALFLRDKGLAIHPPRAVWVTSAPLTESQRLVMQNVFQAPVYDQYGSCEVSWLACECRQRNGLHMMHDLRHIEIVDDSGRPVSDDEWGRILVTDLDNRVMPLIRYEIGDRGRRLTRTCSCGVTLPLMDKVQGRISDVVRLPDGTVISGEFLTTLFDDHPEAVATFQLQQRADFSMTLRCVPGKGPRAREFMEGARRQLQIRAGVAVPVTLELAEQIPHDRGKTRFITSDIGRREE